MSKEDDKKAFADRVLGLIRDLAKPVNWHPEDGCLQCGLALCLGGIDCRCPEERQGIAIAWLPGKYVHACCFSRFATDPETGREQMFEDTRINGKTLN